MNLTPNHPLQRTCRKRPAAERNRLVVHTCMGTRNVENITDAREAEFYLLQRQLPAALAKYGPIGVDDDCKIWIPIEIDYFRDLYVVLADSSLLTRQFLADIKAVLLPRTFIWIVIIHVAADGHDDRVLELSRTETVVFEDSPFAAQMRQLLQ